MKIREIELDVTFETFDLLYIQGELRYAQIFYQNIPEDKREKFKDVYMFNDDKTYIEFKDMEVVE